MAKVGEFGGYWDRLERIKSWVTWLQANPIPDSPIRQEINLLHLGHMEHAVWEMVGNINPEVFGGRNDSPPMPSEHDVCDLGMNFDNQNLPF